MHFAKQDRN